MALALSCLGQVIAASCWSGEGRKRQVWTPRGGEQDLVCSDLCQILSPTKFPSSSSCSLHSGLASSWEKKQLWFGFLRISLADLLVLVDWELVDTPEKIAARRRRPCCRGLAAEHPFLPFGKVAKTYSCNKLVQIH